MPTEGITYAIGSSGECVSERVTVRFYLNDWTLHGEASVKLTGHPCGGIVEGPYGEVILHEKYDDDFPSGVGAGDRLALLWDIKLNGVFRDKPEKKKGLFR